MGIVDSTCEPINLLANRLWLIAFGCFSDMLRRHFVWICSLHELEAESVCDQEAENILDPDLAARQHYLFLRVRPSIAKRNELHSLT
jgi:hypothetical protein